MNPKHHPLPWNPTTLQATDLTRQIPELELLQHVVEHNDWHNDDALRQSLRLFNWVKRLPASVREITGTLEPGWRPVLTTLVDPDDGRYSKHDLLAFTALIHDVGKAKTFSRLSDGTIRCPGHEAAGARMAPDICARYDFSPLETDFVTTLVAAHGQPYELCKEIAALPPSERQERVRRFEADHIQHLLPLLLLACGDLLTSHLQTIRPQKYRRVLRCYRAWLRRGRSKEQ